MAITADKKKLMWKALNVIENDSQSPETDYTTIYIYSDGPGDKKQITIGRGITEYGNLKSLIRVYINDNGKFANSFKSYVDKIGVSPLSSNTTFKQLLIKAGKEDLIYRAAVDKIFEEKYFLPAFRFFEKNGFKSNLAMMVILDSYVHSGTILDFLRSRFPASVPTRGGKEEDWIEQYVSVRHSWLANHSKRILRNTIYRTRFLKTQIANDNWEFNAPFVVNGVKIAA